MKDLSAEQIREAFEQATNSLQLGHELVAVALNLDPAKAESEYDNHGRFIDGSLAGLSGTASSGPDERWIMRLMRQCPASERILCFLWHFAGNRNSLAECGLLSQNAVKGSLEHATFSPGHSYVLEHGFTAWHIVESPRRFSSAVGVADFLAWQWWAFTDKIWDVSPLLWASSFTAILEELRTLQREVKLHFHPLTNINFLKEMLRYEEQFLLHQCCAFPEPTRPNLREDVWLTDRCPTNQTTMEVKSKTPLNAHGSLLVFKYVGSTWKVRFFEEQAEGIKDSKGMKDIKHLLSRPNEPINICDLPGNAGVIQEDLQKLTKTQVASREELFNLNRQLRTAQDQLRKAKEDHQYQLTEELEREIDWIRKQISQNFDVNGNPRSVSGALEQIVNSSGRRFRRQCQEQLKSKVMPPLPKLVDFLITHIKIDQACVFQPPEGCPAWETE